MCLPFQVQDTEMVERCADTFSDINLVRNTPKLDLFEAEYKCGSDGDSIFIISVLCLLLFTFSVIIFYNCYIKLTGREPFVPFEFCPDFLFPRSGKKPTITAEASVKSKADEQKIRYYDEE